MNTKLTLVIEQEIIQKAKEYAKDKNQSLSNIIEHYLKSLVSKDIKKENTKLTPVVQSLKGSFKVPENFDYKRELGKAIEKKHL